MDFFHVMLPTVHEEQLWGQICWSGCICRSCQGSFLLWISFQSQVPDGQLIITATCCQDAALMMRPLHRRDSTPATSAHPRDHLSLK